MKVVLELLSDTSPFRSWCVTKLAVESDSSMEMFCKSTSCSIVMSGRWGREVAFSVSTPL